MRTGVTRRAGTWRSCGLAPAEMAVRSKPVAVGKSPRPGAAERRWVLLWAGATLVPFVVLACRVALSRRHVFLTGDLATIDLDVQRRSDGSSSSARTAAWAGAIPA